ncbi:major facilitator superfamily domain-containing protein [Trichoderma barbatum]
MEKFKIDHDINSSQENPQVTNEPKETPTKDAEKVPDATPKPSAVDYPGGISLIIVFLGLFLAALCVGLDRTIVAIAIPKITSDFNSLDDVGALRRVPAKWVFLTALLIFEVGSIVCATAPSSVALIVGRAVVGIGGAGIVSGTLIIPAYLDSLKILPLHKRPKYTGAMGDSVGIAQIPSPTLGGVFTDKVTWSKPAYHLRIHI